MGVLCSGGVVYEASCIPFGPVHGESGSEEFKYTGKRMDASGLYYFGARYYDPETGRFITEDPVTGSLEDPQGLNRYVYCGNKPLKYTDPDGRAPILIAIGAGGVVGAGAGLVEYLGTKILTGRESEITLKGMAGAMVGGGLRGVATVIAPVASVMYGPIVGVGVESLAGIASYTVESVISGESLNGKEAVWSGVTSGFWAYTTRNVFDVIWMEEELMFEHSRSALLYFDIILETPFSIGADYLYSKVEYAEPEPESYEYDPYSDYYCEDRYWEEYNFNYPFR